MEEQKNSNTYHPSQAKAIKKYYSEHKDEIYKKLKEKIQNDPEFKKKRADSVKKYREKKKLLNTSPIPPSDSPSNPPYDSSLPSDSFKPI